MSEDLTHPDRKWRVLLAVGTGTFVSALTGSIVSTVTPLIMRDFHVEFGTVEWVLMVFLVLASGLMLSFGRLGDIVGPKRVYQLGFGIFIVASVLCGLSPSAGWLIAARGVQAVGSAMCFATGPVILVRAFPPTERGRALGLQGAATYLGLMVGPAMGGLLAARLGWPAVFYVNVPLGLAAVVLMQLAVPHEAPSERRDRFDVPGALLFMVGISAVLLALSYGHRWGWSSWKVLGLLATGAAHLIAFVLVERRTPAPMLDLRLFGSRTMTAATTSALANYICVFGVTFLVPFFLMQHRGLSPARAGVLLSAQALTMAITAPLSGWLSDRLGTRGPATLGMILLTLGLLWLATLDDASGSGGVVARLLLVGAGTGIFISPNSSSLMGSAPRSRQGIASAIMAAARNTGMVLGIALSGAVFTTMMARLSPRMGEAAAFVPAFRDAFLALSVFGVVGAIMSWLGGTPRAAVDLHPGRRPSA